MFFGVHDPMCTPFFDMLFMFVFDFDFYVKNADADSYLQITTLSGPRACLGHLNHHAKSLILLKNKCTKRTTQQTIGQVTVGQ